MTIVIIFSFGIVFLAFVEINGFGFRHAAERVTKDIVEADKARDSLIDKYKNTNKCTQALANQYNYIRLYKKQHMDMAQTFEVYYFAFVLILVIASVGSSIIGVLITRIGWQNQPIYVRAVFLGFFFSASFSAVCMNVFNNAENSSKNITKYFYFTNLQTNIYDALVVGDSLNVRCKDSTLLKVFWENNKNMKDNLNLFFDIKTDNVPATDINKTVGTGKKS